MRGSRELLVPAAGLMLACGLVLAGSSPVYAPTSQLPDRAEIPRFAPADRYLDLGAGGRGFEIVPAYRRPAHRWELESRRGAAAEAPPVDETRYVDLGAFHAGRPPSEERAP